MGVTRVLVIPTERPQSGLKWRNLFKTDFSTPLRCALPWGRLTVGMTRTTKIMLRRKFHAIEPLF